MRCRSLTTCGTVDTVWLEEVKNSQTREMIETSTPCKTDAMAAKKTYTTVSAPKSSRIHAVSLERPNHTLCDRRFSGWTLVPANADGYPKRLTCQGCKLRILKDRVGGVR